MGGYFYIKAKKTEYEILKSLILMILKIKMGKINKIYKYKQAQRSERK